MNRAALRTISLCLLAAVSSASAELDLKALKEREAQVKSLVKRVIPACVAVTDKNMRESGSGVIVDKNGLVLTASHVSGKAGRDLLIVLPDGKRLPAKSLGANRSLDAGMVRITDAKDLPTVELGSSDKLSIGQWCVSIGHPGGYDRDRTPPIRLGRILETSWMGFLQSDCSLINGDSGGPLFDLDGKLIGIHSSIGQDLSENRHVPIDAFQRGWERMKKGEVWGKLGEVGGPKDPALGVIMGESPEGGDGVLVRDIVKGSPAEEAGVQKDDRLISLDGREVKSMVDVLDTVRGKRPGDEVKLVIKRGDDRKEIAVTLAERGKLALSPREAEEDQDEVSPPTVIPRGKPRLGLQVEQTAEGVIVREVMKGSAAERAEFMPGDVLLKVDAQKFEDVDEFMALVQKSQAGDKLKFLIRRDGAELELKAKLGER